MALYDETDPYEKKKRDKKAAKSVLQDAASAQSTAREEAASRLKSDQITKTQKAKNKTQDSQAQGALAGAVSTGLTGAKIGTTVLPGWGTAIGGALGALIGGLGGYAGQNAAVGAATDIAKEATARTPEEAAKKAADAAKAAKAGKAAVTGAKAVETGARAVETGAKAATTAADAAERAKKLKNALSAAKTINSL